MVKKGQPIIKRQSSAQVSDLAVRILRRGGKASQAEVKKLAAFILSEGERRRMKMKRRKKKSPKEEMPLDDDETSKEKRVSLGENGTS
jgi:hypothetical protein